MPLICDMFMSLCKGPGEEEEPGEGEEGEGEDAPGRPVRHRVQRAEHQAHLRSDMSHF